ncbi:hypothetical protein IJU97_00270 [bacterium]|nr:hypothetical protein [bacterium]
MTEKQPINFIKEVAKYFMDFLESDFHKRNAPKRSIALKNEKNYLVGINLKKYEKFSNIVQKLILKKFDKEVFSHIEKGIYYTNIPKDFIDLIDLKVSKISEKEIKLLQERIVDALLTNAQIHKTELNLAISESLDLIAKAYNELILYGFFEDLKQPIESLKF